MKKHKTILTLIKHLNVNKGRKVVKKQSIKVAISVGLISLGLASSADAALVSRLGGLAYYDTEADLTWLADANYAAASGYAAANANGGTNSSPTNIQADGRMGWQAANDWAAQLTVGGVSGWRLADTIDVGNDGVTYSNIYQGVDYGYNITTQSELSNMFYNVLGNTALYDTSGAATGCSAPNYCLTNIGPFSNVQSYAYWSATEYAPNTGNAWLFNMSTGGQDFANKGGSFYGWAVQSGDVGAVPVPAAVWLFGSGLLGLVGVARRNSANI